MVTDEARGEDGGDEVVIFIINSNCDGQKCGALLNVKSAGLIQIKNYSEENLDRG